MKGISRKSVELSFRRQTGVYETPYKTARHMVDIIIPFIKNKSDVSILDPSTGEGIFVKALIEAGIRPSHITAHDIDFNKIEKIKKLGIKGICTDTLLCDYQNKDFIIGNPPYKSRRESQYIKANKIELKKRYGFIGLYNLYSLFLVNAIQHLKYGGIVCFIVQDSFLTNRYYRRFRQYILDNCKIIEIKLAPRRLFHASKAEVRTAIITLQKKGSNNEYKMNSDRKHNVRLIDRVSNENEYINATPQVISQFEFRKMPDLKFFVGVPKSIYRIVQKTKLRFGDVAEGGTGISTGNDREYLRLTNEVKGDPNWVGFYKSGRRTAFYYQTPYYIEKDYKKNALTDPKNFLTRNEQFYFQEGITCSSVGRRFSASYLPSGNLFGVNANFFFENSEDLFHSLGFLNSNLVKYILRKVLNRTNIVTTSFIREIPFINPNTNQKNEIIMIVKNIVASLMKNSNYNFTEDTKKIDEIIFEVYNISENDITEINDYNENIIERA
jgi:tRNA1(Val) A37 N6-methylase TrmN6